MAWPEATDYNEAIQNPAVCFSDADLKQGRPEVNALGWPLPCSGNFAAVYKIFGADGTAWAVKCFTREVAGLRERYHAISAHLRQAKLPFAVDFQYLEEGVRIRGAWYAAVKMRWVEGLTLNDFLKAHADKPPILEKLSQMWLKLARELRRAGIAHADLQHGNVLLVPGGKSGVLSVRLIDYDGMFVPALANSRSGEVGHANYQHPERARSGAYDAEIDRFPHLVIYTALRALLAGGRALWEKHDNGENLLFREQDFRQPAESALLRELWRMPDAAVRLLAGHVALASQRPIGAVPLLAEVLEAAPGETAGLTAEQEQEARALLGEPGGPVRKRRSGVVAARPAAAPTPAVVPAAAVIPLVAQADTAVRVAPLTVAPVGARRRRTQAGDRTGLDPKWLIWGGGAAAALLLVVVVLVAWAMSGSEPSRPPFEPPPKGGQPGPLVGGPDGGQGPREVKPVAPPRLQDVLSVSLQPGQASSVTVRVDRRDYKGRIDLRVSASPAAGGAVGRVMPGKGGIPVGPPAGGKPACPPRVDEKATIKPNETEATLQVTAAADVLPSVTEFEVVATLDPPLPPAAGRPGFDGPGGADPKGAFPGGPQPGAPGAGPGGRMMPGARADDGLVRYFTVTVLKAPRGTPSVLPVGNIVKGPGREMQLDEVWGAALSLDYDRETRTLLAERLPAIRAGVKMETVPAETARPVRMVVVSAAFPYRQQLEEFRKALRLATVEELFVQPETTPRFLGLKVQRRVVRPDRTRGPWQAPLYALAEDGRVQLANAVRDLFGQTAYDEGDARAVAADHVVPGLATPVPLLLSGSYPRLELAGIKVRDNGGVTGGRKGGGKVFVPGGRPLLTPKGMAAPEVKRLTRVRLDELPREAELRDRLECKHFGFDLRGGGDDLSGPVGPGGMRPRPGKAPPSAPSGAKGPPGEGAPGQNYPEKCLVRFVDPDAQPGQTYEYSVEVCMANPNFGRKGEVANPVDAEAKQLFSPAVLTPEVAVGSEFRFYAVDQYPLDWKGKSFYSNTSKMQDTAAATAERAPVQIHLWVGEVREGGKLVHRIGDWVVAERLLVQRGEPIGRAVVEVQTAVWNEQKGRFEVARGTPKGPPPKKGGQPVQPTVPLRFLPEGPAPILVDFQGGKREDYAVGKQQVRDEAALELLVVMPDGSLQVRNGRDDSDRDAEAGQERRERYDAWKQRLADLRRQAQRDLAGENPFGGPGTNSGGMPGAFVTIYRYQWYYHQQIFTPRRAP